MPNESNITKLLQNLTRTEKNIGTGEVTKDLGNNYFEVALSNVGHSEKISKSRIVYIKNYDSCEVKKMICPVTGEGFLVVPKIVGFF